MSYQVEVPEGRSGSFYIKKFTVSQTDAERFNMPLLFKPGGGSQLIEPGTYTGLYQDGMRDPWMSDTPAEIRGHRGIIHEIEHRGGRVLINGLGLGVVVKATLSFPNVHSVDVVEISPDVIALVGPTYSDDPRCHIYLGDAYTYEWPKGMRWDVIWHDIWPTICTDNLEGMGKLHRRFGHRAAYQGSWQRDYLKWERSKGG